MAKDTISLLPLHVEGVKVTQMTFSFEHDELKWSAQAALIVNKDQRLTTISVGNNSWNDADKAELDIKGYELAGKLRPLIEQAVIRRLNSINKTLDYESV
jgi:hypothetical protein